MSRTKRYEHAIYPSQIQHLLAGRRRGVLSMFRASLRTKRY